MSLSKQDRERALEALTVWGLLRLKGLEPDQDILERFGFGSVEAMRIQLGNWDVPDWVTLEESAAEKPKPPLPEHKKSTTRLRHVGPRKDLPPAANATDLFKERLEALLASTELLEYMNETLYGKYFGRTNVETVHIVNTLNADDDLDSDDETFWTTGVASLPGRVGPSPSETLVILIGVYALAGGPMSLLLDALHPDPASVDAETRAKIQQFVVGGRRGKNTRDGLIVVARNLASLVRGGEVGPGRPSERSEMDHAVASITTKYRKDGLTDEEITRKLAYLEKEDGTSYSVEDVTELGDLGLSWS
jgi:hypothetical protein